MTHALDIPELVDCIVDHLHGDPASLRCTSLVSHLWVYPSQHHLLQKAHVYGLEDLRALLSHVQAGRRIGGCVVTLCIDSVVIGNSPAALMTLLDLSTMLPRLQDLVLKDVFCMRPLNEYAPLRHARGFLRSLTLNHCDFKDITYLVVLLQAFPIIDSLHIDRSIVKERASIFGRLPPGLCHATTVDHLILRVWNGSSQYSQQLSGLWQPHLLRGLLSRQSSRCLSLDSGRLYWSSQYTQDLCHALGLNLEEVNIFTESMHNCPHVFLCVTDYCRKVWHFGSVAFDLPKLRVFSFKLTSHLPTVMATLTPAAILARSIEHVCTQLHTGENPKYLKFLQYDLRGPQHKGHMQSSCKLHAVCQKLPHTEYSVEILFDESPILGHGDYNTPEDLISLMRSLYPRLPYKFHRVDMIARDFS